MDRLRLTARPRSAPVPIPSRKLPRLACELTSSTTNRLCSRRRHGRTVLTGRGLLSSSRLKPTIPGRCRGSSNTSSRQPSLSPTLILRLSILEDDYTTSQEGPIWCPQHPRKRCGPLSYRDQEGTRNK